MSMEMDAQYMTASGMYEAIVMVMLSMPQMFIGMESMGSNFLQYQQHYWCKFDNISSSLQNDSGGCDNGYEFDASIYEVSVSSEFLLVEESAWINDLLMPIYMAGFAVGSLTTGILSDRMGRKWTFMLMCLIHIVGDILVVFSMNEWMYAVGRFVTGLGAKAAAYASLTLLLELVSPKNRAVAGMVFQIGYCVGTMVITGVAYYVRHFRVQQLVLAVGLLSRIAYFWALPESPRWLIANGKYEEAIAQMTWLARLSRSPIPDKILNEYTQQKLATSKKKLQNGGKTTTNKNVGYDYQDLVSHPTMRYYCITVCVTVASIMLMHNGIGLSMGTLAGNIYVNLSYSAALDLPVYLSTIFLVKKFGCVKVNNASLAISLMSMIVVVPMLLFEETIEYSSYISLLGRAVVGSAGSVIWIYVNELYPTALRQRAVGTASSIGCALSIAAPIIGGTLVHVWQPLPILIFGSLTMVSLLLFLRMPETKGRPMANTIEDSINFRNNRPKDDPEIKFGGFSNKAFTVVDSPKSPVIIVGYRQLESHPITF